jgi:hypothetical protein
MRLKSVQEELVQLKGFVDGLLHGSETSAIELLARLDPISQATKLRLNEAIAISAFQP